MKFCTTVEASFEIPGRGCAIVLSPTTNDYLIRAGYAIQLRAPSGKIFDTRINSVEMVSGRGKCQLGICLPNDLRKEEVPAGTEIWLVDQSTN